MSTHLAPFPDELLTSWWTRRNHDHRGRVLAEPRAVRDRVGQWRHPDIRPASMWLNVAAKRFGVETSQLRANTIDQLYPELPLDFLAWDWSPFATEDGTPRTAPRLAVTWCSRCLAEDFAAGRPAHIRHQWTMAASGFCHLHCWPLEERCSACNSIKWAMIKTPRGPLRMFCAECWRPLEQSLPAVLSAADEMRHCWNLVIAFESEVFAALRGKTPDQFRFNFTSSRQLLNQVRDICYLLARNHWGYTRSNIPLNGFVCSAMTPGRPRAEFYSSDAPFPLAVASMSLRRCLLAATCAIIDTRLETGIMLFGPEQLPAIESFVAMVDDNVLDRCQQPSGRWSPSFVDQIEAARHRRRNRSVVSSLQRAVSALNHAFAT